MPAIFPDMMAPVSSQAPDGARELVMLRWGMPSPAYVRGRGVTNRPLFGFAGICCSWLGVRGTKANPVEGEYFLFGFLTTEPNAT
jgi:putative SOS response-associated peptidase YedK